MTHTHNADNAMQTTRHEKALLSLLLLTAPLVAYALTLLRPTFDDWTYTTYPNTDPAFWKYLLPYGDYWRPFDGAFGYVVALGDNLFPALNHLCIYAGHLIATLLVWLVARQLGFSPAARLTAASIHYVSPAILGTLMTLDSLNQAYASCWGLAALWAYLRGGRHKTALWLTLCLMAMWCKENGAMWLAIGPLVAWCFGRETGREVRRHLRFAALLFAAYWAVRLALPNYYHKAANEYLTAAPIEKVKNVVKYLLFSYTSMDFVSLLHRPSRNVLFLLLTALLSAPYFLINLILAFRRRRDRRLWGLLAASWVAALPHLATLFSTMHAYAGLAPLALLAGWLMPGRGRARTMALWALVLYGVSALAVDVRHYAKAYQSGMDGYHMALETIRQTHKPTHRVCCLCVDRGEEKYSCFCVIPYDSYGWGNAVVWQTRGRWPQVLDVETIGAGDNPRQTALRKLREGYDHVWIADGKNIQVIER